MKVFILNNFVSFMTRTPKSERNLKDTVYSSAYIYSCIYSKFLHSCSHIYMTGARMGSQRKPKRFHRTHETWAMCHLSGPEIWECGGCDI